eukprot:TRINITY_DN6326_c0_g2_i1.p2 TRINITY_DN6326_c0_g2~~TRINITY_DN6326_c0_g2_i1.p2  ORF type:complete len:239 (+),score=62.55 TRINITY_DN6326_c0_g2_i1:500-1216(+)
MVLFSLKNFFLLFWTKECSEKKLIRQFKKKFFLSYEKNIPLKDVLIKDEEILAYLSKEEIEKVFEMKNFFKQYRLYIQKIEFNLIFKQRKDFMSNNLVIIGAQWGDEGKGKIVHYLSKTADYVVRYQGGSNAGHTVYKGDKKYVFHLLPSGIIEENKICLIGSGVVLNPDDIASEIEELQEKGIDFSGRLFISENCHVVLAYHKILDAPKKKKKKKKKKPRVKNNNIKKTKKDQEKHK